MTQHCPLTASIEGNQDGTPGYEGRNHREVCPPHHRRDRPDVAIRTHDDIFDSGLPTIGIVIQHPVDQRAKHNHSRHRSPERNSTLHGWTRLETRQAAERLKRVIRIWQRSNDRARTLREIDPNWKHRKPTIKKHTSISDELEPERVDDRNIDSRILSDADGAQRAGTRSARPANAGIRGGQSSLREEMQRRTFLKRERTDSTIGLTAQPAIAAHNPSPAHHDLDAVLRSWAKVDTRAESREAGRKFASPLVARGARHPWRLRFDFKSRLSSNRRQKVAACRTVQSPRTRHDNRAAANDLNARRPRLTSERDFETDLQRTLNCTLIAATAPRGGAPDGSLEANAVPNPASAVRLTRPAIHRDRRLTGCILNDCNRYECDRRTTRNSKKQSKGAHPRLKVGQRSGGEQRPARRARSGWLGRRSLSCEVASVWWLPRTLETVRPAGYSAAVLVNSTAVHA